MDAEERQSIIDEAVEKSLLMLPKVIGNLVMEKASQVKFNKEFFDKHPELKNHRDIVIATAQKVESEYPGLDYGKVLEKAIPLIKEQIKAVNKLDTKQFDSPSRMFPSNNGEL